MCTTPAAVGPKLIVPDHVPVRLAALPRLFDVADRQGASVGQLSSLIGEELLIELTAHWLAQERGAAVVRLADKPTRDDDAFTEETGITKPRVRDLDAWLLCGQAVFAVEAKMRTAASLGQVSRALDDTAKARKRWALLSERMTSHEWDQDNKVLLPLRRPEVAHDVVVGTPIYAVWWPVSDKTLAHHCAVMRGRSADGGPADVTVFSGSLYVQHVLSKDAEATLRLRGEAFRTTIALLRDLGCLDSLTKSPGPP